MVWPEWDVELFIWLHGLHHPILDAPMVFITGKGLWLGVYILAGLFAWRRLGWRGVWILLASTALVAVCDPLCNLSKGLTERLRPCHDPLLAGQLRTLIDCGGRYSFPSAHAANGFTVWYFLKNTAFRLVRGSTPWHYAVLCFVMLHAYSRVYIAKHYPLDLMVGVLLGVVVAWAGVWCYDYAAGRFKVVGGGR